MEAKAVLAPAFIPQAWREINQVPATHVMDLRRKRPSSRPAEASSSSSRHTGVTVVVGVEDHLAGIRQGLVPPVLFCGRSPSATDADSLSELMKQACSCRGVPLYILGKEEEERRATAVSSRSLSSPSRVGGPGPERSEPPVPHPPRPPAAAPDKKKLLREMRRTLEQDPPASGNNNNNASDSPWYEAYRSIWEYALWQERKELIQRYQEYAQYHIPIQYVMPDHQPTPPSAAADATTTTGSARATTFLQAVMEVPGLADVHPPLLVGDTVLLRPTQRLSIWQPAVEARPPGSLWVADEVAANPAAGYWTPPVHIVEIQCTLLAIHRVPPTHPTADGTKGGVAAAGACWLHVTWMEAAAFRQFRLSHPAGLFHVRFLPSVQGLERTSTAVDWWTSMSTQYPQVLASCLYPAEVPPLSLPPPATLLSSSARSEPENHTDAPERPSQAKASYQLNGPQESFVQVILARTLSPSMDMIRGPVVLTGPAGVGKSQTLLQAILAVLALNRSETDPPRDGPMATTQQAGTRPLDGCVPPLHFRYRILVCTPSHTACDVVTRRLGDHLSRQQLFRLYDPDRPVATVPPQVLPYCRQSAQTGGFILPPAPELLQFVVVVCTTADAHLLYQVGLTNHQLRQRRSCYQGYLQQTLPTLHLSATLYGVNEPHFTHFFLDEAAQATEPESLIPLSVVVDPEPGSRKVELALVGDPRQLSPTIYSTSAAQAGLDRSWMERLLQRPIHGGVAPADHASPSASSTIPTSDMLGPSLVQMDDWLRYSFVRDGQEQLAIFLTRNYRGHPALLMMPSVLFYSDKLQSAYQEGQPDPVQPTAATLSDTPQIANDHLRRGQIPPSTLSNHGTSSSSPSASSSFWGEKLRAVERLSRCVMNWSRPAHPEEPSPSSSMHPDELSPEVQVRKQWSWPIHFRAVYGTDQSVTIRNSGSSTSSWSNPQEAQVVAEILSVLAQEGVPVSMTGVMAPFRGQVVLIRSLLRERGLGGIDVGTVEDYQAKEKAVCVVSITRSNVSFVAHDVERRMGFFDQEKRSNVALTRPEHLLIVAGNPATMAGDEIWQQFLWFCLRNGFYYEESSSATSTSHLHGTRENTTTTTNSTSGGSNVIDPSEVKSQRVSSCPTASPWWLTWEHDTSHVVQTRAEATELQKKLALSKETNSSSITTAVPDHQSRFSQHEHKVCIVGSLERRLRS